MSAISVRSRLVRRAAAVLVAACTGLAALGVLAGPVGAGAPAGPLAYVVRTVPGVMGCALATIDLTTGAVDPLGDDPDVCSQDLTVAPDGTVYGVGDVAGSSGVGLHVYDPQTGELVSADPITGSFTNSEVAPGGIAATAEGVLYVLMVTDEPGCAVSCVYTVDPVTAAATLVGPVGLDPSASVAYLAVDCAERMLSLATLPPPPGEEASTGDAASVPALDVLGQNTLFDVNPATGAYTPGPPLSFPAGDISVVGIDVDKASDTLYALIAPAVSRTDVGATATAASVATINRASGVITSVVPVDDPERNVFSLAIAGGCAPEPAPPEAAPIVIQPTFTG